MQISLFANHILSQRETHFELKGKIYSIFLEKVFFNENGQISPNIGECIKLSLIFETTSYLVVKCKFMCS